MRQAITTEYRGPTDSRDSRIIVKADKFRSVIPWDHALNVEDNHIEAAKAFAKDMGWAGTWSGGGLPGGSGYVFVLSPTAFEV